MSLLRAVFSVAVLLLAGTSAFAQFPIPTQRQLEDSNPNQSREVVAKYCRLDYEGARLDPQAWPRFQPIVSWTKAPEYSHIDVIARYTIDPDPSSSTKGKYTVSVHYRLLGTYDLANGYVPEPTGAVQNAEFTVAQDNTDWKISDAENPFPHVSRAAMLKWLNQKLGSTDDLAAKDRYQKALTQLQEQSASPFAK